MRFQSTFPRGERRAAIAIGVLLYKFQSTFPRGERHIPAKDMIFIFEFQSTFPRGERRNLQHYVEQQIEFQSTFPRGERRFSARDSAQHKNFNPRSRVGNDRDDTGNESDDDISIHVPAWGTTRQCGRRLQLPKISIHVPAWGTTENSRKENDRSHRFQSTFPRGERPEKLIEEREEIYFNPRSRVGNDSKFSQIFFAFLCNKYNFSTFYYPFSLFFGVIHFTFLIFVVRILPVFYVYF